MSLDVNTAGSLGSYTVINKIDTELTIKLSAIIRVGEHLRFYRARYPGSADLNKFEEDFEKYKADFLCYLADVITWANEARLHGVGRHAMHRCFHSIERIILSLYAIRIRIYWNKTQYRFRPAVKHDAVKARFNQFICDYKNALLQRELQL